MILFARNFAGGFERDKGKSGCRIRIGFDGGNFL